jgi:AcrR family transcriptional regulator
MSSGVGVEVASADRRERRKAESRRRLLEAARRLFVAQGYHETRPAEIAAAADLAHGTFYLHFADKRAFVDEAASEIHAAAGARVRGRSGFVPRLRASLEAILDYSAANPGVLRAAFADAAIRGPDEPATPGLRDRLAEVLASALRDGMARAELRCDYDPLLTAYGIVGFVQQCVAHSAGKGAEARAVLIDNAIRFCGRALLRAPEGEPA